MIDLLQTELPLASTPSVDGEEVASFLGVLRGAGWVKARELAMELGWMTAAGRVDDRKVRAMANHAGGQVISGQQGYRLTAEASLDEVHRAAAWMRHQARAMEQRASETLRVAHGRLGR